MLTLKLPIALPPSPFALTEIRFLAAWWGGGGWMNLPNSLINNYIEGFGPISPFLFVISTHRKYIIAYVYRYHNHQYLLNVDSLISPDKVECIMTC